MAICHIFMSRLWVGVGFGLRPVDLDVRGFLVSYQRLAFNVAASRAGLGVFVGCFDPIVPKSAGFIANEGIVTDRAGVGDTTAVFTIGSKIGGIVTVLVTITMRIAVFCAGGGIPAGRIGPIMDIGGPEDLHAIETMLTKLAGIFGGLTAPAACRQ